MAERDPKGELILMSCLGYVFEINQAKFTNFHERVNIGKDLTRGLLMWYRGGYPDHSKNQHPPYVDEKKLTPEEYEYCLQFADACLHVYCDGDHSRIVGVLEEWDQKE